MESLQKENNLLKEIIVKKVFNGIKYIENQTDSLKKFAIEQHYNEDPRDFCVLKYIKDPTEKMIKLAIDKNYENIVYVKNPSVDIQLYLVKKNPNYIGYIENPDNNIAKYVSQHFDFNKKLWLRYRNNRNQLIQFDDENSSDSEINSDSETIDSYDSY